MPRITVVTPSFNQAEFLERTMRSVIDQGYQNLEYIVIDGGSTDGSVDILRKYEKYLAYWVSEPDRGQVDAINKGLRRATGDWLAWQNSDDIYYPGVFDSLARVAEKHPDAELIIGDMMLIDATGRELRDVRYVRPSHKALLAEGMVLVNQAAFWRREVHQHIGWLDESLHYSFDYEWFLRLTKNRRSAHVSKIWGGYRLHEATKTSNWGEKFSKENQRILQGRSFPRWLTHFYRLRRLALLLAQRNFQYIFRGVARRLIGKGWDSF